MSDPWHIVIPARMGSTRLAGKVLADLGGQPVVQHVWASAVQAGADSVTVATDSDRIAEAVVAFGGEVAMTSSDHPSGSDRIAEVCRARGWQRERVVNVQGDEPFMPVEAIRQVADMLAASPEADIATLCAPIEEEAQLEDPNCVKVVRDAHSFALLFSRAPIPFARAERDQTAMRHIGIYGYRADSLARMVAAPPCALETTERLEQLRALWLGMRIKVDEAMAIPPVGIDTEADLERARQRVIDR